MNGLDIVLSLTTEISLYSCFIMEFSKSMTKTCTDTAALLSYTSSTVVSIVNTRLILPVSINLVRLHQLKGGCSGLLPTEAS